MKMSVGYKKCFCLLLYQLKHQYLPLPVEQFYKMLLSKMLFPIASVLSKIVTELI